MGCATSTSKSRYHATLNVKTRSINSNFGNTNPDVPQYLHEAVKTIFNTATNDPNVRKCRDKTRLQAIIYGIANSTMKQHNLVNFNINTYKNGTCCPNYFVVINLTPKGNYTNFDHIRRVETVVTLQTQQPVMIQQIPMQQPQQQIQVQVQPLAVLPQSQIIYNQNNLNMMPNFKQPYNQQYNQQIQIQYQQPQTQYNQPQIQYNSQKNYYQQYNQQPQIQYGQQNLVNMPNYNTYVNYKQLNTNILEKQVGIMIHILKGQNIAKKDICNESDPYCVVKVNNNISPTYQKLQTHYIIDDANPVWGTTFVVKATETQMRQNLRNINFQVFDYDIDPNNDFIGGVSLDILWDQHKSKYSPQYSERVPLTLLDHNNKYGGSIEVQIIFIDPFEDWQKIYRDHSDVVSALCPDIDKESIIRDMFQPIVHSKMDMIAHYIPNCINILKGGYKGFDDDFFKTVENEIGKCGARILEFISNCISFGFSLVGLKDAWKPVNGIGKVLLKATIKRAKNEFKDGIKGFKKAKTKYQKAKCIYRCMKELNKSDLVECAKTIKENIDMKDIAKSLCRMVLEILVLLGTNGVAFVAKCLLVIGEAFELIKAAGKVLKDCECDN